MSLSTALNTALSGLSVNARMAEIVSSNVANASTEGYGVRSANLASVYIGGEGAGVRMSGISRNVDFALLQDRRNAEAEAGFLASQNSTLSRIEDTFGQVGSDDTLAAHLARFEGALIEASADPMDEQKLQQVGVRLQSLTSRINASADEIQQQRINADQSIAADVSKLNSYLTSLEKLNSQIVGSRGSDQASASLLDQKQILIDRVSAIVPVRELVGQHGETMLITDAGQTLFDGKAVRIVFEPSPTITADMTLESGALSALTISGDPLSNGIGKLTGGTLAASFGARDTVLTSVQRDLDMFAFDFASRLEQTDASLATGELGILTDGSSPLSALDIDGFSGRLMVNALAADDTTKLRTGFGSLSGVPDQLEQWIDGIQSYQPHVISGVSSTLANAASRLSSAASQARVSGEENHLFAAARSDAFRAREYEAGVDTDAEMQRLLQIEKAYAANARLIQTADAMMQTLMEI